MAGLRAVEAAGYFDVEVICEGRLAKPPQSCFLDGLQVGTGATLGKRNLSWTQATEIVVRVKNTVNDKQAAVRPTAELVRLLSSFKPQSLNKQVDQNARHEPDPAVEALARKVAAMEDREILTVQMLSP
jgi:formylmethanofuran dehydrogenase subunit E